jgi:hypothetical protein
MKTLSCDVCRHTLEDPIPGRTYYHIAHRELCEDCKDDLEAVIKPIIRTKDPFAYEWYAKLVNDSIEKAIQKGKF